MKLSIFSTLIFCMAYCLVDAQTNNSNNSHGYVPSLIPPSPNAAALMKFTDVPVSPYTGTTDITIPIYMVQVKGVTVPVSVAYHTGGIRLKEEASSVGLGWALSAGGMISRNIMGHDDFGTQGDIYLSNNCPQLPGDILMYSQTDQAGPPYSPYLFDFWCDYKVKTTAGTEDFSPAFTSGGDTYDMEPDVFSYSFPGHSGKFILTRSGQVVMQKQENIRIQFQGSGNQVTFSVVDEQGNSFYFSVLEVTAISPKPAQISSWLLSKIVTQEGDIIMFNYQNGGNTQSGQPDVFQNYSRYCPDAGEGLFTNNDVQPYYTSQMLESIDFKNGHIKFAYDGTRADLPGGNKLDSVIIYAKDATGTQTYLKQDNFYYSYFNSGYHPSPYEAEYYRLKLDSVRESSGGLILAPYKFAYNNSDPGYGSAKHAFNVDHWGYYNGTNSNSGLIPTMDVNYSPRASSTGVFQILHYQGANRDPAFPAMQTFSLQQVTYPTGGKTKLIYEANDYDYNNSASGRGSSQPYVQVVGKSIPISATKHGSTEGTLDLTSIYPVIPSGSTGTNVTVSVTYRFNSSHSGSGSDHFPYTSTAGKLYFDLGDGSGFYSDINGAACASNSTVCTYSQTFKIAPAVYHWTAYIDPTVDTVNTFAGIYVGVVFNETEATSLLQQNENASPASGLRVQSITQYQNDNSIATQKTYNYGYDQDKGNGMQHYSYGRLMSTPSYVRYGITNSEQHGYCTALYLSGSSTTSLTSLIQGNIVGYDQVTEKAINPSNGQDIGKTVYSYFNNSDTVISYSGYGIPGVLNMGNNLNGLLLSKTDFANTGTTYTQVDETDYYYHTTNRVVYFSPKYEYIQTFGVVGTGCSTGTGVSFQTNAWFYPSIKSERVLLDSTKTILYQQGDPTNYISSTVANFYDNPVHYLVTRTKSIDSKGNLSITGIKYPQDYVPSGNSATGNNMLDGLIGRNMVGETVEKTETLFSKGSFSVGSTTSAQLNLYRPLSGSNVIVHDTIFKLDVSSPVTDFSPFAFSGNLTNKDSRYRQMISFDSYDQANNLQQFTATDLTPTSLIWDYQGIYPIAQAKNAMKSQIAYTSFEADGSGNWTFTNAGITSVDGSVTGKRAYALSAANPIATAAPLPNGNYMVTFWLKAGSGNVSVNGNAGIAITTKNGWGLYSITLANTSSVSIVGSGIIDELRLYPAGGQMTTYTYAPLIGMTSQCDAAGHVSYYEYDNLQRVKLIRDQDKSIIKQFDYQYRQPQ